MAVSSISVALFKKMVLNGATNLKNNQKKVDELNVFPVPDGDTGTNMSMTVMSGVREMSSCESSSIVEIGKVLSRGALMGARGNSGVILSQFFRGFYVGMQALEHNYLDLEDLMRCLESGCKVAYKAVMEPVEGTILTVVREAAEATRANMSEFKNINSLLKFYEEAATRSLENTPNLLPVLKEAGVVDSGGSGFLEIIKGMVMAVNGKMVEVKDDQEKAKENGEDTSKTKERKYLYCVEFIMDLKEPETFDDKTINATLSYLGDSLVINKENQLCKVHIHTNRPGRILDLMQKYGEYLKLKVENLRMGHNILTGGASDIENKPKKAIALVAVCFGDGISQTFKDLGVDYVIEGGQTMNPSTEAFVAACKSVNAENIIIIPNNGNVIMAAEQSVELVEDAKVKVLRAKTIAQGYASLMVFDSEADLETNFEAMSEAIKSVKTGEITYSIRDTEINGIKITKDDFMGIAEGKIVSSTKSKVKAIKAVLKKLINKDSEIVTFFCGKNSVVNEVEKLEDMCHERNPEVEVEIIEGKQDIYSYIIAVE